MRLSRSLATLCLSGTALAGLSMTAQAAVFTQADVVSTAAPAQGAHFDVFLPLRNADKLESLLAAQQTQGSGQYHHWLTPAQFAAQFGPSSASLAAVARELAAKGFTVKTNSRSVHADGTIGMVNAAFGTTVSNARNVDGTLQMVAMGGIHPTPAMQAAGAQMVAFSNHRTTMHVFSHAVSVTSPRNRYGATGGYWYNDLKQAYAYPAYNATVTPAGGGTAVPYNGTGASIGALMSSDMLDADVSLMFYHEGYTATSGVRVKLPTHTYVSGATPGAQTGAFDEASLDIQQESGGAPGAAVTLYDIPDLTDGSITSGYLAVVEDNKLQVLSSSFGGCELAYTPAYNNGTDYTYVLNLQHQLFQQGNAQGITFLASSGDESGLECPSVSYFQGGTGKFVPSVSVPAADPDVTAVGGTNLVTNYTPGSYDSTYVGENAYSDPEIPYDVYGLGKNVSGGRWGAGGGVSSFYPMPSYQTQIKTSGITGRMVPDVGMQVGGCPGGIAKLPCNGGDTAINGNGNSQRSYVEVAVNGTFAGLIGTSVSSPEFASVVALITQRVGRVGNLNPYIYLQAASQYKADKASSTGTTPYDVYHHSAIPGFNGVKSNKQPAPNYNYTIGAGTLIVNTFVGAPTGTALAGVPRTISNP